MPGVVHSGDNYNGVITGVGFRPRYSRSARSAPGGEAQHAVEDEDDDKQMPSRLAPSLGRSHVWALAAGQHQHHRERQVSSGQAIVASSSA